MAKDLEFPITATTARPLCVIAEEIWSDWTKIYFGAVPYLEAMRALRTVADPYGLDPGDEIVARFLANAGTWRGPVARRVKAELRAML